MGVTNDKELSKRRKRKCSTVKMKDYLTFDWSVFKKGKSVAGRPRICFDDGRKGENRITRRTSVLRMMNREVGTVDYVPESKDLHRVKSSRGRHPKSSSL